MIAPIRPQNPSNPEIDLSGVKFPSDAITIDTLRRKHSKLFDICGRDSDDQPQFFFNSSEMGHCDYELAAMLYCERLIAVSAYYSAKGIENSDEAISPLGDIREELIKHYIFYETASGTQHALQLIRDIERQARDLAQQRQP